MMATLERYRTTNQAMFRRSLKALTSIQKTQGARSQAQAATDQAANNWRMLMPRKASVRPIITTTVVQPNRL